MDHYYKKSNQNTLVQQPSGTSLARNAFAKRYFNNSIAFIITGLRPLLGPAQCCFAVTCGTYAVKQLQEKPLFFALLSIGKRLIACNPFFGQIEE